MSPESIPQQPYLLRAMHEWITDSGYTPYLIVDATVEGVQVPQDYIQDGKITLNASYAAVRGLELGNEAVIFEARFAGAPFSVALPMPAIRGIYARETGSGMIFSADDSDTPPEPGDNGSPSNGGRPHLKVIK